MNLGALKEKLGELFMELWGKIQENSIYMSLREKYESLNARVQSAILAAAAMLVGLFIFWFPYSYISESQDYISSFEENRTLIRELLKASKNLKEPPPLPPEIPAEALSSEVSRALEEFHLVPDQVSPAQPLPDKVTNLVPAAVHQLGLSLHLKKLNLKQIVEISHRLETLSPGVKMMGLDITENAQTSHYFDVVYKLASFSVPVAAPPVPSRQGKAPPKKSKADEGE